MRSGMLRPLSMAHGRWPMIQSHRTQRCRAACVGGGRQKYHTPQRWAMHVHAWMPGACMQAYRAAGVLPVDAALAGLEQQRQRLRDRRLRLERAQRCRQLRDALRPLRDTEQRSAAQHRACGERCIPTSHAHTLRVTAAPAGGAGAGAGARQRGTQHHAMTHPLSAPCGTGTGTGREHGRSVGPYMRACMSMTAGSSELLGHDGNGGHACVRAPCLPAQAAHAGRACVDAWMGLRYARTHACTHPRQRIRACLGAATRLLEEVARRGADGQVVGSKGDAVLADERRRGGVGQQRNERAHHAAHCEQAGKQASRQEGTSHMVHGAWCITSRHILRRRAWLAHSSACGAAA